MSRVFVSEATGAAIYVFADDHCPPHVHARHRGEGWIARVGFSYVDNTVAVMSLAPTRSLPLRRVVNALLDDVQAQLAVCRRSWWIARQTTCLENQWAVATAAQGIELRAGRGTAVKQIAVAPYDPATARLAVTFRDGTMMEISAPA